MEQPGRHRRSSERSAIASPKSDRETYEDREIALALEVQRVRDELAEERERRIAAEALAEERGAALELARRAARFRRLNPSGSPQEILLGRPTLPLRGNWLQ